MTEPTKATETEIIKHLEFAQTVIARMAQASFIIKGWSITLVSATMGLAALNREKEFILLAFVPAIAFMFLDAYYLQHERFYRNLYEIVRKRDGRIESMMMDLKLLTVKKLVELPSYWLALGSGPLLVLHGTLLVSIVTVFAIWRTGS